MSERLPPAVQAHADELRWYGYKVAPMTMVDHVELAVKHGFVTTLAIAEVLDLSPVQVGNALSHSPRAVKHGHEWRVV